MSSEATGPQELSQEFVTLLTGHQADLWGFLLSLMPGHPDVADVLQKTNVVLWTKREQFTPGTDFKAWAFTVARFEMLGHFKTLKRQPCFVFDDDLIEQLAEEAPSSLTASQPRLEALEHCLGQLRPKDRELLEHRYHERGSIESYAQQCGRSISALSVTLFRLRAALRRCVQQQLHSKGGMA